jgi:hypothetical protein
MKRSIALAVIGLLVFTGVAVASLNGTYSGKPSKGSQLQLTVSGGKVTSVHYITAFDCAGTNSIERTSARLSAKIKNHKFSASGNIASKDHLTISGKFSGKKVTGKFSETFTQLSAGTKQTCRSGTQTYSATK